MPLDIGSGLKSVADWFYGNALVRGIVGNPIFAALLITVILMVILMAGHYDSFRSKGWKKALRSSIYAFLAVSAIFFVHHYGVLREARAEFSNAAAQATFQSIVQQPVTGAGFGVEPTIKATETEAKPAASTADAEESDDSDEEEDLESTATAPPAPKLNVKPPRERPKLQNAQKLSLGGTKR